MSTALEQKPYAYGRDREFTEEEFDALMAEVDIAIDQDDDDTIRRLIPKLPMDADVMMAFASVYGRDLMSEIGFDLTQANMKFGEGWLNALKA